MANADQVDLDMTNAEKPVDDANPVVERARLTFTALWIVLALLAAVAIGTFLIISHHTHATALTPGQPQKPAAVVLGHAVPTLPRRPAQARAATRQAEASGSDPRSASISAITACQASAAVPSHLLEHGPECRLQGHRGGVAGQAKRSFAQHASRWLDRLRPARPPSSRR